jgi:hypothetical protein
LFSVDTFSQPQYKSPFHGHKELRRIFGGGRESLFLRIVRVSYGGPVKTLDGRLTANRK